MARAKYILAESSNTIFKEGRKLLVHFHCPGCDRGHYLRTAEANDYNGSEGANKPIWGFNCNLDLPTFTPSILIWRPWTDENGVKTEERCHSFVTDGKIQFLVDCTHSLKNQTVDLPEF